MGLAAPKNRTRISNDPQNTTWANNTTRFGHRILTTQGWTPGSSLGAEDAAHASHYTAASHSHIRVLLKDDTLGLGAKRGSGHAENFALAALESVLGRLNGREADVKKEEERRQDIERRGFVARKFGFMNFVSGGFLVGDKIERKIKKEDVVEVKADIKDEDKDVEVDMAMIVEKKKEKKRKRSGEDDDEPKLKRKKKSMNLRAAITEENEVNNTSKELSSKSKSKKDKKSQKSFISSSASPAPITPDEPLSDKAKRKAERAARRARKEEKRLKKALKKAAKEAARSKSASDSSDSSDEEEEDITSADVSMPTTGTSTPTAAGLRFGGRHAVRTKYIRQKKMASMDPQAMREIFMIKSPS